MISKEFIFLIVGSTIILTSIFAGISIRNLEEYPNPKTLIVVKDNNIINTYYRVTYFQPNPKRKYATINYLDVDNVIVKVVLNYEGQVEFILKEENNEYPN